MVTKVFTPEQRLWLQQYTQEYNRRVQKLVPGENGSTYANERGKEFTTKWTTLLDGQPVAPEEIIKKVVTFFKNSNQPGRGPPLLPIKSDTYVPSAPQLYISEVSDFREEYHERRSGQETSANLPIYTALKKAKWEELSADEQSRWHQERAKLKEQAGVSDQSAMLANRNLLQSSLTRILTSYSAKTDASFYLLVALPPEDPAKGPIVSRLALSSIPEFTSFRQFARDEEETTYLKWKEYAAALEKKRGSMERLKNLVEVDEAGFPKVPRMNYNLTELGQALTAYLEQLWYKLHESYTNVPDIPWSAIATEPSKYMEVSVLPTLLLPFQVPNQLEPPQIFALHDFLKQNADKDVTERFPFIIQPNIPPTPRPKVSPMKKKQATMLSQIRDDEGIDWEGEGAGTTMTSVPISHLPVEPNLVESDLPSPLSPEIPAPILSHSIVQTTSNVNPSLALSVSSMDSTTPVIPKPSSPQQTPPDEVSSQSSKGKRGKRTWDDTDESEPPKARRRSGRLNQETFDDEVWEGFSTPVEIETGKSEPNVRRPRGRPPKKQK